MPTAGSGTLQPGLGASGGTALNAQIKRQLDELYLREPCLGSRKLVTVLARDHGIEVNRKRVQRLRREMGLEAIYCKPRTSIDNKTDRTNSTYRGHGLARPLRAGLGGAGWPMKSAAWPRATKAS